ncbi:MAG: hisH [Verrucomicrobiales bacterium]|nr:hisH [Verrucomicrobiales bacterium]
MIIIVDYGVGNLGSIQNMIKQNGGHASISGNPEELSKATKLILPGVGAFDYGMDQLHSSGLVPFLNKKVLEEKTPILGICLGAQLLTRRSEEGVKPGLGWIDADTKRFRLDDKKHLKIPHMGWDEVSFSKPSKLTINLPVPSRFYFVHSYHFVCDNAQDPLMMTEYGYPFVSAFEKGNVAGVQFHPEKSHKFGLQLLKNFVEQF